MLAISRWTTLRLSLLWIGPHRYTDHPSPKSNGIARNYNMQMKRHGSHSLKDGRMSLGRQTLRRTCRSSKHIYMTASQSSFRMTLDIEETHAWMGILWTPCSKRSSSKRLWPQPKSNVTITVYMLLLHAGTDGNSMASSFRRSYV